MADFFMSEDESKQDELSIKEQSDLLLKQKAELSEQKAQERLENRQLFGVEMSDEEYAQFKDIIADAENPDQEAHRIGSAVLISRNLGTDLAETYVNIDNYNQALYGPTEKITDYKSFYDAIKDSIMIGKNGLTLGKLGQQLKAAEIDGDLGLAEEILKQVDLINKDNELRKDNAPRSWITEQIKSGMQSAPFSAQAAALGFFGNFIMPGLGTILAFGSSSGLAAGQEYLDLREQGVSPEVARKVSDISGGIQGLFEVTIGETLDYAVAGAGRKLSKSAAASLSKKASEKFAKIFHYSGGARVLANILGAKAIDVIGEGLEEVAQEATDIIAVNIARTIDGLGLSDETAQDYKDRIVEAFKGGIVGAIVLGLPMDIANTRAQIKDYSFAKQTAKDVKSFEVWKKQNENNPVFDIDDKEKKSSIMREVWNKAQSEAEAELNLRGKEYGEVLGTDENFEEENIDEETGDKIVEPEYRNAETGLLESQNVVVSEEDGIVKGVFGVGDPTKQTGNKYAEFKYTLDENTDTVTIDELKVGKTRLDLKDEVYDTFARNFAGKKIEWNAIGGIAKEWKEDFISANPQGKNAGLNYYNSVDDIADSKSRVETIKKLKNAYKQAGKNLTSEQAQKHIVILESLYRRLRSQKDFQDRGIDSFSKYIDYTFGNKMFGDVETLKENAKYQKVSNFADIQGAAKSRTLQELDRDIKAIIYVTENSDFSTFVHEIAHIARKQLTGELLKQVEDAIGVKEGNWTEELEEKFAYGFEQFLREGKVENEVLRPFFEKVAQFLADVFNRTKPVIEMSPEIEKTYNELLSMSDNSVLAAAEKAVADEEKEARFREQQKALEQQKQQAEEERQQKENEREQAEENSEVIFDDEETEKEPVAETIEESDEVEDSLGETLANTNLDTAEKEEIENVLTDPESSVQEKTEAADDAAESSYDLPIFQVTDNNGNFDVDDDNILLQSNIKQAEEYLDTFADTKEKDRIKTNLKELEGTPWYKSTVKALCIRQDINAILNGEEVPDDSIIKNVKAYYDVLTDGDTYEERVESLYEYFDCEGSLVGSPSKCINAVGSSFINCNPSKECATFCYAAKGRTGTIDSQIANRELVNWAIEHDPKRAADIVRDQYVHTREYKNGVALRLLDTGDLSEQWLDFIKYLNAGDELGKDKISCQIFSKRPELLSKIDSKQNVVLLSIDESNETLAEQWPTLPVAYVLTSKKNNSFIINNESRFTSYGGSILPVAGNKASTEAAIAAMKELPKWTLNYTCPIDAGWKEIGNNKERKYDKDKWNCSVCDTNGQGCFFMRAVKDRKGFFATLHEMPIGVINGLTNEFRTAAADKLRAAGYGENDIRSILGALDSVRTKKLAGIDTEGTRTGYFGYSGTLPQENGKTEGLQRSQKTEAQGERDNDLKFQKLNNKLNNYIVSEETDPYAGQTERDRAIQEIRHIEHSFGDRGNKTKVWTILRELEEKGISEIKGKKIDVVLGSPTKTGWDQLRQILEVYRNKSFETFRYILVNSNGNIVNQYAVTSKLPGYTSVTPSEDPGSFIQKIHRTAVLEDCKIILVHNHPSGKIDVSDYDVEATEMLARIFGDRYGGHLIMDHNKYALNRAYTLPTLWHNHSIEGVEKDPLIAASDVHSDILGSKIESPDAFSEAVAKIYDLENNTAFFHVNADNTVTALEYIGNDRMKSDSLESLSEHLFESGRRYGTAYLLAYGPKDIAQFIADNNDKFKVMDIFGIKDFEGSFLYSEHDVKGKELVKEIRKEYLKTKETYENTDLWLKAPNGKDTKLSETQWIQVRTPGFKAWFGDWENDPQNASKVVDENGEPLVVYHGTKEDFDTFDFSKLGKIGHSAKGFHFVSNKEAALRHGTYYDWENKDEVVGLRAFKNLYNEALELIDDDFTWDKSFKSKFENGKLITYDVESINAEDFKNEMAELLSKQDLNELTSRIFDVFRKKLADTDYTKHYDRLSRLRRKYWKPQSKVKEVFLNIRNPSTDYKANLREYNPSNYDGQILKNVSYSNAANASDVKTDIFIIPENANQIKSAVDNSGAFDPNNDNMLLQTAYHGSAADFDKFNTEQYGLSGEGSMSFGYGVYVAGNEEIARDYAERQFNQEFNRTSKDERLEQLKERVAEDEKKLKTLESPEAYFSERDESIARLKNDIELYKAAGKSTKWVENLIKNIPQQYTEENRVSYLKSIKASLEQDKQEIAEIEDQIKTIESVKDPKRHLYTLDIPDNGFIKWDKTVPKTTRTRIVNELYHTLIKGDYAGAERELRYELQPMIETPLSGQELYQDVWTYLGSDKEASQFLNKLGYAGIDYPAGTNFGTEIENARNYVIFDDSDAKIVDHLLYQTKAELYADAKTFATWQDFMDFYETMGKPEVSPIPYNADAQWYQTTWELANNVVPEESINNSILEEKYEKEGTVPTALDALFVSEIVEDDESLMDFLRTLSTYDSINLNSEEYARVENEEEAQDRERISKLQDYMKTIMYSRSWKQAMASLKAGNDPTPTDFRNIRGEMRDNFKARDFRALYAEVTGDQKYAVADEDKPANIIAKRYAANPGRYYDIVKADEDFANYSPEKRKQIAKAMDNADIAAKIRSGKLKMNDEVYNYIKSLDQKIKSLQKELATQEIEKENDYKRIADAERRELLRLHGKMLVARSQYQKKNDEITRKMNRGIKITDKYSRHSQNLKANYDELFRKFSDLKTMITLDAEVQSALKRQEQIHEIKEEIGTKQQEKSRAAEEKKLRIQLVKRTMRRIDFKKIDYEDAKTIIAIQRIFEPNLLGGVNRWIGTEGPFLRGVISGILTDEDYKKQIEKYLQKNSKSSQAFVDFVNLLRNTKSIEDFNKWTQKDRKAALRYLPKENWIKELNLLKLAEEREESIDLDIDLVEKQKPVYDEKTGEPKTYKDENGETHPVTATAFMVSYSDEIAERVKDAIGADMFDNLINVPFADWTFEQLEDLAMRINALYKQGRDQLEGKKLARKEAADKIRQAIETSVRNTGIIINDDDDDETKQRKLEKINKILGLEGSNTKGSDTSKETGFKSRINRLLHSYNDANVLRVARILDGYTEGTNVQELYRKEDNCYIAKTRSMNERAEKIRKVMEDNNITASDLAQVVRVEVDYGVIQEYTVDDLLFFAAAAEDYALTDDGKYDNFAACSRNAVMYGNMFASPADLDKKQEIAAEEDVMDEYGNSIGLQRYIAACNTRFNEVLNAARNLDPKFQELAKVIAEDYAQQYDRMNKVAIEQLNQPVHRVKCYVPLTRLESNGDTNANKVKEDLLAAMGSGANRQGVDKGMTARRVRMNPLVQKPVVTGLYKTWADSVERTEHFIAYCEYVNELNRVYKSRDAVFTRQFIENRYGKGMINYIDDYINEVANPNANKIREAGAELLHTLRGRTAPAYLAWKASAIVKQGLTSPWPFMQYITPAEYLSASWKAVTSKGEIYKAIREKSVYMKNRVMDPMNDLIDEMAEYGKTEFDRFMGKQAQKGMAGLEWIDWVCVAPGWYAAYQKEYARLNGNNQNVYEAVKSRLEEENAYAEVGTSEWKTTEQIEAEAMKAMQDDVEKRAVQYADDITRACQPSNRSVDIAPLFKNSSEAMKAYLQFQTSLNVIWQNIKYDIQYNVKKPDAVAKEQFFQITGIILGYALAGIFMNSVMDGLGGDDDKDGSKADDRLKNLVYYATTQFTDAVPMVGTELTNTMDRLITGKSSFQNSGTDMTPTATRLFGILTNAKSGNWEKAAQMTAEGIGMYLGLPVSGLKEVEKLAGVDDKKPGMELNLGKVYGILDKEQYE